MGVRAAQEHHLLGTAQRDVGDKLATAAQVAVVLLAQNDAPTPLRCFAIVASPESAGLIARG